MQALAGAGWQGVFMHLRGTADAPSRCRRSHHAAAWPDLDAVVAHLHRQGRAPHAVVGFSLGAAILLHWLAHTRTPPPLAVAISPPFDLAAAAARLRRGLSRLYQAHLLRAAKAVLRRRPEPPRAALTATDFRAFDQAYTAPVHGYADVDDYYRRASPREALPHIASPTLVLHAEDDPFLPAHAIPPATALGPGVSLELARRGGHVGFVGGAPWRPRYWLEERILAALAASEKKRPR